MEQNEKNPTRTSRKTIRYWIAAIFTIIILGIGIFALYINSQLKPVLTERIKETVINSSDSLYTIDFDDVTVNFITGNVSFKNIVFKPDSLVYLRLKQKGIAPRHLYRIELNGLILNRVNPRHVYFKKVLKMDALIIDQPRIRVYFEDLKEKDVDTTESKTIYQHLSKYLNSVNVQDIVLQHADFKYIDRSKASPDTTSIRNLTVKISDLLIDSAAQYDKKRFYYTKDIFVQVKDHKQRTKDGFYDVGFDELVASTANAYLNIKGVKVTPLLSDLAFSRKFSEQHDRYDLKFDEILLNNIDFRGLNLKRSLRATSLMVKGAVVKVFLNRELPPPAFDKGRNFPHRALKRLQLNTNIDTVKIEGASIYYTEYNPKTAARGTVYFNRVNGVLRNVTNDSVALTKNNWCRSEFSALLMGKAALKLAINLNLTDVNARFNYSGSLGSFNARDMNPVLRPLGMVEIKSGKISKALFSINGNSRSSSGTLRLYYTDLKVGVLAKEDDSKKLKKKGLISLIANALLISDNNPSPGDDLRVGYTSFVRPASGSFFNMMWKSLFEGIKVSVGFSAAKEKELQDNFSKMKGSKPDRIERREERKEKREERREKK